MGEVLTLAEVAARLKLPVRTTRTFVVAGTIRGFKVGHQWRVLEDDLERYIQDQRHLAQKRSGKNLPNEDIRKLKGWDTFT